MRIIGGRHRGRRIEVPAALELRPSADRLREAVFNILAHGIDWPGIADARIADLFAGTGAYGLEALSRGARFATFIERDPAALGGLRRNAARLGDAATSLVLTLDATRLPSPPAGAATPVSLAFLDPPYGSGFAVPALLGLAARGWLDTAAIAVVELAGDEPFDPPDGFALLDERRYGRGRVVILRALLRGDRSTSSG